jgi:site-specific DNA-methyltransferase (cytosine-N4-specific)
LTDLDYFSSNYHGSVVIFRSRRLDSLSSALAVKKRNKAPTTSAKRAANPRQRVQSNPAKPIDVNGWASAKRNGLVVEYKTALGAAIVGKSEDVLDGPAGKPLHGQVQLVFSSPPFPLNRKKKYGNKEGQAFKKWLSGYAEKLSDLLKPDGSIVIEMGNAWMPRLPVMSTLAIETLLAFKRAASLYLVQEFIWFNHARLPSPAQWVTVNRIRAKDAFTRLWWMSPTAFPKADNRRVLAPYSGSMKSLLATQRYNAGKRPSEHGINATSFLKNNGGAIPPNVITKETGEQDTISNLLVGANTSANDSYYRFCKTRGFALHPARMPVGLAKFFINLCTEPGDLVFDPFAGSNTTGAAAEELQRRWITVEAEPTYAATGRGRFPSLAALIPPKETVLASPAILPPLDSAMAP